MGQSLVVLSSLAVAASAAAASPNAVGATAGARLTMISDAPVMGRVALGASRRWCERWHTGARFAVDFAASTTILQPAGELGIWLHASRSLDVLLGWRVGYARFEFPAAAVGAIGFEPVAEISYAVSPRIDFRVAPFTGAAYHSGLWQVTFGPEVGIAWRL